jgi:imidazolonepropionase-like amidohydrolase
MIIHCVFTEADGSHSPAPDLVARLAAADAWVNPTLYTLQSAIEHFTAKREREGLLSAKEEARLAWTTRELDLRLEAVGRMIRGGVKMAAGSDSPWAWYAPGGFAREVEMMAQAGLSNADAIVSGTAGAADSIGVGDLAGCLEAGRQADVLVVQKDPSRDLAALRQVLDLYQAGRRVERGVC